MGWHSSPDEIRKAACLLVAYMDLLDRGLPEEEYRAWREKGEQMFAEKPIERLTVSVSEILQAKGMDPERILGVAA